MELPHFPELNTLRVESEDPSLISLVEQGLHCFEQGHYTEGAGLFRLASYEKPRMRPSLPNGPHASRFLSAMLQPRQIWKVLTL